MQAAVGEFYLRQWPLVVGPGRSIRAYRLPYAMAGIGPHGSVNECTRFSVHRTPEGIAFAKNVYPDPAGVAVLRAGYRGLGASGLGAIELPDRLTPMTSAEAAAALATAYKRVTLKAIDQKTLGLLLGQTALETGNWKSLHNFNMGNAKFAASTDAFYQDFRCSEIEDGKEVFYDPPDYHCRFAAHQTAADGAEHYIRVLMHRPHWWNGLQTKTPEGFIAGLTTPPVYFTANPRLYLTVLTDRMAKYSGEAKTYATTNPGTVIGGAVGVFVLVFGSYYLYSTATAKKRAA